MGRGLRVGVFAAVGAWLAAPALAHNTNTAHTRITEAAILSIIAQDAARASEMEKSAYAELYAVDGANQRINWGHDPRYNQLDAVDKGTSEFEIPYTVMDGVVLEDAPVTRVFSHFYHGYSGAGGNAFLNTFVAESAPSAVVGHRYFDQAIEAYGYQDEETTATILIPVPGGLPVEATVRAAPAKEMGFYLFGHALHHAEDMSSIAHSHNDAHLTAGDGPGGHVFNEAVDFIGSGEKDDFESNYVPTLLWLANVVGGPGTNGLDQRFFGPPGGTWTPIEFDHLNQIWSPPRAADLPLELGPGGNLVDVSVGLSRSVVNATLFQGDFGMPTTLGCAEDTTTGEMAEMFDRDGAASCSIFFELDTVSGFLGWRIDPPTPEQNVGWYLAFNIEVRRPPSNETLYAHRSAWWPMSTVDGPRPPPSTGGEYYYIEQLMEGVAAGFDFLPENLLRPEGLRESLDVPWDPDTNRVLDAPIVTDDFNLTGRRSLAEHFSETVVPLATRYAAGLAQLWYDFVNTPPYLEKMVVRQDNVERYSAEWLDISETRVINLYDELLLFDEPLVFNYVAERNLVIDKVRHIDPEREFEIVLRFNEPVQDVGDDKIAVWLNDMAVSYGAGQLTATPPAVASKWESNREWTLKVTDLSAVLPNGAEVPEGEVRVTVQAYDRNFHRTASGVARSFGARLDENPGTPARRQRLNPEQSRDPQVEDRALWGVHPWHDGGTMDVNFPDMELGDFAYDRTPLNQPVTGDSTHVLLFDIEPPEASLEVQR